MGRCWPGARRLGGGGARVAKRVLMLLENDTYPQDTRVLKEATTLTENGYRVALICPRRRGQRLRETVDGVEVYRYPRLFAGGGRLGLALEYAWAMFALTVLAFAVWARRGFDIVHLHNPPDALFIIALPYKLAGKRLVYDQHDLAPELLQAKSPGAGRLVRLATLLEGLSCGLADVVLTESEPARRVLLGRHRFRVSKVTVVGNGPEAARMAVLARTAGSGENGRATIGYLGYLDPQDGLGSLLTSLECLIRDCGRQDFHCLVIGDGEARPALEREATSRGLDRFLSFTGRLSWEEAMRLLAAADVCVDPAPSNIYHDNNTAVKVLEYMALGRPMVLYDLAGHRAAAADAALYARPGDERDFALKISQLMDDKVLAHRLGELGRERFQEQLSWEKMGGNLVSAYSTLFAPKNSLNATAKGSR
jgi:glycosyltransferase involved in cell wall biosynthesis